MASLYANALNETEKLWKRRRTKAFLLLALLLPIATAIMFGTLPNRSGIAGAFGNNLPMLMLGLFTFALLPLFLFMLAADSFSGEASARTLKLVLVRPITRAKVFTSKIIAIVFYVALLLGTVWIASTVSGLLMPGGRIADGLIDSIKAYSSAFVPMAAIGLIAALIAQIFSSTTGAMAVMIFIYAAAKLLPFVFPQMSVWSVFSYTDWYVLWVGGGTATGTLLNTFVLLLSYCIMAYMIGWMLFERKQL